MNRDGLSLPHCHANGCEEFDLHPELPFCKLHFNILPEAHRKKLWALKWPVGHCPLCWDSLALDDDIENNRWKDVQEWLDLANLGIAIICRAEFGRHGCPNSLVDDAGFCWGCGCHDVPHVYEVSEKIIQKFGIQVLEDPL